MQELIFLGTAHSVHTFNLCKIAVEQGFKVTLYSLSANKGSASPQNYEKIGVKLYDKYELKIAPQNSIFKDLSNNITSNVVAVTAISAVGYGYIVGCLKAGFYQKNLILLGSEAIIHQHRSLEIVKNYKNFDKIIAPTHYLAAKVECFFPVQVEVQPLGIDPLWFDKPKSKIRPSDIKFKSYFLSSKFFKWIYGFNDIIKATSLIQNELRKNNIGFIFCGDGAAHKKELLQLAKSEKVTDLFQFLPFMPVDELINYVDHSLATIYPSRYESFGLTLLESLARKKEIICSNISGYSDASKQFQVVEAFESRSYRDLANNIMKTIKNTNSNTQLKMRADHASKFNWNNISKQYINSLINKNILKETKPDFFNNVLLINKSNTANLLKINNAGSAREIRSREIYEALEKTAVLNVVNRIALDDGFSFVEEMDLTKIDVIYVEHGSVYNENDYSFDKKLFKLAGKFGLNVQYFLSDSHELDPRFLISVNYDYGQLAIRRRLRQKQIKLIKRSPWINIAYPSQEFGHQNIPGHHKNPTAIPPACRYHKLRDRPVISGGKLGLVYGGGIGPFYQLHRGLVAGKNNVDHSFLYLRKRDFDQLNSYEKHFLVNNSSKIIFNESLEESVFKTDTFWISNLLLEPISYIKSAHIVKIYTGLELFMPIITYKDTVMGDLVEEHNIGWVTENKITAIEETLQQIKEIGLTDEMVSSIRKFRINNTWDNRAMKILGQ